MYIQCIFIVYVMYKGWTHSYKLILVTTNIVDSNTNHKMYGGVRCGDGYLLACPYASEWEPIGFVLSVVYCTWSACIRRQARDMPSNSLLFMKYDILYICIQVSGQLKYIRGEVYLRIYIRMYVRTVLVTCCVVLCTCLSLYILYVCTCVVEDSNFMKTHPHLLLI